MIRTVGRECTQTCHQTNYETSFADNTPKTCVARLASLEFLRTSAAEIFEDTAREHLMVRADSGINKMERGLVGANLS